MVSRAGWSAEANASDTHCRDPAPAPVQDYYDYAPYSHDDYSLPYYAYSVPVELWSRFFHNHHSHPGGFHRAFRGGWPHGGLVGVGFHAGGGGHGGQR